MVRYWTTNNWFLLQWQDHLKKETARVNDLGKNWYGKIGLNRTQNKFWPTNEKALSNLSTTCIRSEDFSEKQGPHQVSDQGSLWKLLPYNLYIPTWHVATYSYFYLLRVKARYVLTQIPLFKVKHGGKRFGCTFVRGKVSINDFTANQRCHRMSCPKMLGRLWCFIVKCRNDIL